jgi:uncharacterized RDD family membrane protein YckC
MGAMSTEQTNPYAPPESDIASAGAAPDLATEKLATRWARFGGAFVDGIIAAFAFAPAFAGFSFAAMAEVQRTGAAPQARPSGIAMMGAAGTWGLVAGALVLGVMVVNWYLLVKRGQTIGKIVAHTRVVLVDGSRAPFTRVVALRAWPILILQYVPILARSIGPLLSLVDVLFIFRKDRRCLHDLVAGTKVVAID